MWFVATTPTPCCSASFTAVSAARTLATIEWPPGEQHAALILYRDPKRLHVGSFRHAAGGDLRDAPVVAAQLRVEQHIGDNPSFFAGVTELLDPGEHPVLQFCDADLHDYFLSLSWLAAYRA